MNQVSIPVAVSAEEVARKQSLGAAIVMCMELAGYELDKEVPGLKVDKAQFSRWKSGEEGIKWPKLEAVMDACGNDAPLLWMLHRRGYDLSSLRKRETETQRELRIAQERIRQLETERQVERRLLSDVMAGRASA